MALGYFPVVPLLLLLEFAKITGETTTQVTTSPPTSMSMSEPHHFTPLPDTTGVMETTISALKITSEGPLTTNSTTSPAETTTRAAETTGFLLSSVALLSDTTSPWSTLGETSLPRGATTLLSSSSPAGSTPAGTPDVTASSSSLAMISISSTSLGGPSEEGTTQPAESTMLDISSTTEDTFSMPRSPTPQDKMTTEGPLTTISTTSPAETTSEKHASSPPTTTETTKTSPLSASLHPSSLAISACPSATSGVGDTTGSSEVTMTSEAEITSWWPGSSLSSTYSSVTQDRSTPKATSTGLLSSRPGRSSLGLSTPSSTTPSSEGPATTMSVVPSTTISPSAFPSPPQTAVETTEVTISLPSMSTSESHHFTSVSDTTGVMKTTTPALKTTEFLPSSVALLSDTTSPWSTLGETNLPGGATTLLSSSSPEGSTSAGTSDVTASSSSLAMTSISSTAFGGPSKEGTTQPKEPTMLIISSTTEDTISIPYSPIPQDKMTSEAVSTIISTTSQADSTSEKHSSSPSITTETTKTSPLSVPLPTSSLATSTLLSATSGVGDTTGSSKVAMSSKAEITSWWPGSSLSSTYSSVTQDRSTPKATSTGLLSSNPGRSRLGLSTPSSTTPSSEGPATTMTVVPSITTSPSAFTSLPQTAGETTSELTTFPPTRVPTSLPHLFTSVSDTTGGMETTTPAVEITEFLPSSVPLLSKTTSPWSTLGERSLLGGTTTLLSSSSPEGSTSAGTPDITVASSSLAMSSIASTSFGGPSEEGTTLPSESTMLVIRSTTQEMNSSSCPPTPREKMTSEGPLTTISTTSPAETTTRAAVSSVTLLSDTTSPWSTLGETSLSGGATTLLSSSSPEGSTPAGTSDVTASSSSLAMTSISSTAFGGPSKQGTTQPKESTMLVIRSTTQEMNSSSRSPTPRDKMTSEGPLTTISTISPAETTSEKHARSLPLTTETITTSPLFPLLTSTLVTSTPMSGISGLGNTTGSSAVTMSSEAKITSWWPGSSLSSTYSSVTQDRSTPKVTSAGLLSSRPGRSSLGLSTPSFTTPSSEGPATTMTVVPSIITSPSAFTSLPQTAARNRFILSVRFSTPLNVADLSVRRAMLKWLDHELQAKFPVGNFHLTWMG